MDQLPSLDSLGLDGGGRRGSSSSPPTDHSPSSLSALGIIDGVPSEEEILVPQTTQTTPTAPQLTHQSNGTAIYRLNDIGYKVILDPTPSEEQTAKLLQHEKNISQFLPTSCHKRQVIDVTTFNDRTSLSFKWANGITLKEWLQNVMIGPRVDLDVRLRAAMAIAKTLSDFHKGGVAYNSFTPDNIVLSPFDSDYIATLIDLSNARVVDNSESIDGVTGQQMKEQDLKSLGLVLNQLFQGGETRESSTSSPEVTESDTEARPKRGRVTSQGGEGLPFYLGSLISALLECTPDFKYESAYDVFLDLKIMAENKNGCFMKCKLDDSTAKSRLSLKSDMFYGRGVQMSMLMHLFTTITRSGSQPMMATISGCPGAGKSTLVNQIKKPIKEKGSLFIEGKFDMSVQTPTSILATALDSFFGEILENNAGSKHMSMKWRIHDVIGSGSNNILLDLLPNLKKWISDGSVSNETLAPSHSRVKRLMSSHRLKFLFCKLISAIACRDHPLVLFLDDLQWADEMTFEVIRMIMTAPDIRHFLFLGSYRDNEVNLSHPLGLKLRALQEQGISMVSVKVGPIEKECVNTLLSEALCLPPSLTRSLSTVVHSKTGGIIMFVLRFVASLNDEGDLWYSMSNRRWMYQIEDISVKEIHGDVVSHMTENMKNLSKEMRMGLKVAACLGTNFEAKVIEKVKKDDDIDASFLQNAQDYGYLQKVSESEKYVWAHDQIQQAAYDLIPPTKREEFHLLVGSRLFIRTSSAEIKQMLYFIVDNMNRGASLIVDQDQKCELAQLNLDAGERAISQSAFTCAEKYLLTGLSLLGPDSWENQYYDLTLQLHDAASEALYVTGNFGELSALASKPLMHARTFEDKLNIYNNLVRASSASCNYVEGLNTCLNILSQLGEYIPAEVNADIYVNEVTQVKELLHGKTRQELLSLPKMTDTNALAAMQFLSHALTMSYASSPMLNPILVFRMVKMTILHGICNISSFAFGCYGAWLVSEPTCDIEGGHRMGRMAIEMMKRLGAIEMMPRLYVPVYGFTNIWKEPWQAAPPKHLEAYESGATSGDMEYALTNLFQCVIVQLYGCGQKLVDFCPSVQSYAKRAFQCNNRPVYVGLALVHQLALDLMGVKDSDRIAFTNGMTEESLFIHCRENHEVSLCRAICIKRKYLSFFTGDLDAAAKAHDLTKEFSMGSTGRHVNVIVSTFIDGLIAFCIARKHREDEEKWYNVGIETIQSLRKWVNHSEWNFANKLHLIEAEYYFLKEDDDRAVASYNASIKAAREHRFIHEEGLAEEKFATYLLHKSRHDEAMHHFNHAKKCYETWGAQSLVERIDKAIAILLPLCM